MNWERWVLRVIAALSVFQVAVHFANELTSDYLWDLRTYTSALDTDNPYDISKPLLFVYGPMVVDVLHLAGTHLFEALLTAYVAATAWFINEVALAGQQHPTRLFLIALSTGGMGIVSLMSGNLTVFLHFAVLSSLLATLRLERGSSLLLLVLIGASIVKPYFLALMLLAPMLGSRRRLELLKAGAAAAAVALVYLAYYLLRPGEMEAFREALRTQVVTHGDFGSGVAALASRYGAPTTLTVAAIALSLSITSGWAIWFLRKVVDLRSPLALLAAYAALSLINPRVHVYDLFPIFFCLLAIIDRLGWPHQSLLLVGAGSFFGALPSLIREFAHDPRGYPPGLLDYTVAQHLAIACAMLACVIALRNATGHFPMQNRSKI